MVLDNYYPPDIRVSKEANTLIKHGFDVNLLCWGSKTSLEREIIDGLKVFRLARLYGFKKFKGILNYYINFVNPIWLKMIDKIVREIGADILHVHDLPLVKTCLKVAEKYNIPVIADLHENYPEAVKDWMSLGAGVKSKISNFLMPVRRWRKYEKNVLKHVTRVITIVEENVEHYVKDCGLPREKIVVIRNTDLVENLLKYERYPDIIERYKGFFIVTYIGAFGPHRGLEIVLKATPLLVKKIQKLKILIVGGGGPPGYDNILRSIVKELGIEEFVEFTGWVDYKFIPTYIYISNICLIPYKLSNHTNDALPHKLFQYMAFSKPVIATRTRVFSKIIEGYNCGLLIPSEDYETLADCIIKLYTDKDLAYRMGLNGLEAVNKYYNWSLDAKRLVELYNDVL